MYRRCEASSARPVKQRISAGLVLGEDYGSHNVLRAKLARGSMT